MKPSNLPCAYLNPHLPIMYSMLFIINTFTINNNDQRNRFLRSALAKDFGIQSRRSRFLNPICGLKDPVWAHTGQHKHLSIPKRRPAVRPWKVSDINALKGWLITYSTTMVSHGLRTSYTTYLMKTSCWRLAYDIYHRSSVSLVQYSFSNEYPLITYKLPKFTITIIWSPETPFQ